MNLFETKRFRTVWNEADQEWYFSVCDVVESLTDCANVKEYIKKMRRRDLGLDTCWETICPTLELLCPDGKRRKTQCANAEGLLRIVQSISSPKAEHIKRWLADVGSERLNEIGEPELAVKRVRAIYKAKGYSDAWVEMRLNSITIHSNLTQEWQDRGVKEHIDQAALTAEISRATFDMTPAQYKTYKGLDKPTDNHRDHMTDLELILSVLGEFATREIARGRDAQGIDENRKAAISGGTVAGNTRRDLERLTGQSVLSRENFLTLPESAKRMKISKT
jgi:hypothetical protein